MNLLDTRFKGFFFWLAPGKYDVCLYLSDHRSGDMKILHECIRIIHLIVFNVLAVKKVSTFLYAACCCR